MPSRIYWGVPASITVVSREPVQSGQLSARFVHDGLACECALVGQTLELSAGAPGRFVLYATSVAFQFDADDARIEDLASPSSIFKLLTTLTSVANRGIRALRNFGYAVNLHEMCPPETESARQALAAWSVTVDRDGTVTALSDLDLNAPFFSLLQQPVVPALLDPGVWPMVAEAIEDDLTPPPEVEFTANALENLRTDNYRYALLEAIIGLEIVLSRYTRNYLDIERALSQNRIEAFLRPDLGLTARVAVVLDLIVPKDALSKVDLSKVLSAVRLRNTVVHKTGKLPPECLPEEIRDAIVAVLKLTGQLAFLDRQLVSSPELKVVAERVSAAVRFGVPAISLVGQHRFEVLFHLPLSELGPTDEEMSGLADLCVRELRAVDTRVDRDVGLFIAFSELFGGRRVYWQRGQVTRFAD